MNNCSSNVLVIPQFSFNNGACAEQQTFIFGLIIKFSLMGRIVFPLVGSVYNLCHVSCYLCCTTQIITDRADNIVHNWSKEFDTHWWFQYWIQHLNMGCSCVWLLAQFRWKDAFCYQAIVQSVPELPRDGARGSVYWVTLILSQNSTRTIMHLKGTVCSFAFIADREAGSLADHQLFHVYLVLLN